MQSAAFTIISVTISEGQEVVLFLFINMSFPVMHGVNLIILCKLLHLLFVLLHKVMIKSLPACYYLRHIFDLMDWKLACILSACGSSCIFSFFLLQPFYYYSFSSFGMFLLHLPCLYIWLINQKCKWRARRFLISCRCNLQGRMLRHIDLWK